MRDLDVVTRAAMCRMFDESHGNVALVAKEFGVEESQVWVAVVLETRRMVAEGPRDPAPARRLYIVPKGEAA